MNQKDRPLVFCVVENKEDIFRSWAGTDAKGYKG